MDDLLRTMRRKRAEIIAGIEEAEHVLFTLRADLSALDGTLAIFDPTIRAGGTRAKPTPPKHPAYKGEMTQIVLQALQEADRPMSTLDVARVVMNERALDWENREVVRKVRRRALACLSQLRAKGLVESETLAPKMVMWNLPPWVMGSKTQTK